MRGRTFSTLYTIVRVCLLLSLTIAPFIAGALERDFATHAASGHVHVGRVHIALPGVRLALWFGGAVTVLSGLAAQRRMRRTDGMIDVREIEAEAAALDLRGPEAEERSVPPGAVESRH